MMKVARLLKQDRLNKLTIKHGLHQMKYTSVSLREQCEKENTGNKNLKTQ